MLSTAASSRVWLEEIIFRPSTKALLSVIRNGTWTRFVVFHSFAVLSHYVRGCMECVIRKSSQLITLSRSNYSVNLRDIHIAYEEIIIKREKRLLFTNWRAAHPPGITKDRETEREAGRSYVFICFIICSIPFPFSDTHSLSPIPITVIIGPRHPATKPLPVICVILPKINPGMFVYYTPTTHIHSTMFYM